jgi:hypothetical protein
MMKKLTRTVKKMLDAMAFADAGENMTLRDKSKLLDKAPGDFVKAPVTAGRARGATGSNARRVALYLGSELPPEVMDYIIQTCVRLKHELTVLTFGPENASLALLQPHEQALQAAGIDMQLVTLKGEPLPVLSRYLRGHSEIAFLACKDSGYLGRSYLTGIQQKNALPVPVVVVATQEGSAATPAQSPADQDPNSISVA